MNRTKRKNQTYGFCCGCVVPDESVLKDGACVGVELPAARLVFAPTGPLGRDQDDVRRFGDAAAAGIKR